MSQVKQIKVNAIKNGTVIDHITAGKVRKVLDILEL
nr:aspartate carbamoyltransferase regulatory subunit [Candidatus Cloacimonadota bacterium]